MKKKMSKLEVLQGYVKIYNCYKSVIEDPNKEHYSNRMQVCDKVRDSWAKMCINRLGKYEGEYFIESLLLSLSALVSDLERSTTDSLGVSSSIIPLIK